MKKGNYMEYEYLVGEPMREAEEDRSSNSNVESYLRDLQSLAMEDEGS
jgi:hypothetical protein